MNDINLIRWLGVRYNAITDDVISQRGADGASAPRRAREALLRRFSIRRADGNPHGLISELLMAQGVHGANRDVGSTIEELLLDCFVMKPATVGHRRRERRVSFPGGWVWGRVGVRWRQG